MTSQYPYFNDPSNLINLYFNVWDDAQQTWEKNVKTNIAWKDYLPTLQNNIFKEFQILNQYKKYFIIKQPKGLNELKIGQIEKNINLDLKVNGVNFPLYYYSNYQPGSFVLPKGQNWSTSYETNYNEVQNKLRKSPTIPLDSTQMNPGDTKASSQTNTTLIQEEINGIDPGLSITNDLTFTGQLQKGKTMPVEVYYKNINQDFPILVKVY